MTLEFALAFIEEDELVEITPKNIRLRKRCLAERERKLKKRLFIKGVRLYILAKYLILSQSLRN